MIRTCFPHKSPHIKKKKNETLKTPNAVHHHQQKDLEKNNPFSLRLREAAFILRSEGGVC